MPPECIGATIYSVFNSFRGGFTILIRSMAFVFAAAALLALPCGAHACPDHAAVVQAVSASWQGEPAPVGSRASRHEEAVRAECSASAHEAPCTDRLCCVTPPAAPRPSAGLRTPPPSSRPPQVPVPPTRASSSAGTLRLRKPEASGPAPARLPDGQPSVRVTQASFFGDTQNGNDPLYGAHDGLYFISSLILKPCPPPCASRGFFRQRPARSMRLRTSA